MGAQPGTDFDSKAKSVVVSIISSISANGLDLKKGPLSKASLGTPIQRIAAPEEVAALVSYVASDSAGFVTGEVDFFLSKPSHFIHPALLFVLPAKANVYVYFSSASCRGIQYLTLRQISVDGGYILD